MSQPKAVDSIDACAFHLHSWRPFHLEPPDTTRPSSNGLPSYSLPKRPCLSDRTTSFSIDSIDLSNLSLLEDERPIPPISSASPYKRPTYRLFDRKRRRRGSRSLSGRSSDRSGTRRCCSVGASAAQGTCSDFPVAVATDSSGELFVNGDANWSLDVSEAKNSSRKDREKEDKENNLGGSFGQFGGADPPGNESGYGSEPGYRGDAEFGYGDEVDEEEEDTRLLFWGDYYGETDSRMEIVGENTFSDQKAHYRCRRKKHDCRMAYALR